MIKLEIFKRRGVGGLSMTFLFAVFEVHTPCDGLKRIFRVSDLNCYAILIHSIPQKNRKTCNLVVLGTIAPSRGIPELTAEDAIRIILANLNLVVPVVAAILVILIAIIVICILRSKGHHDKGL